MSSLVTSVFSISVVWILSAALFISLAVFISKRLKKKMFPLKAVFIIMFFGGMTMYSIINYRVLALVADGKLPAPYSLEWMGSNASWFHVMWYVIMKSIMDVGMMICGRCNTDLFYKLPEAKYPLVVLSFWMVQLIVFFMTATALLIRFGSDLLRWIRITTSRVSEVDLLFGVNSDSLAFGRNIAGRKGSMLVYVDSVIGEDYESSIRELGGLTYSGNEAVKAGTSFLRRICAWRFFIPRVPVKKLKLYALSDEYDRNLQYALRVSEGLQELKFSPDKTELVLLGTDEKKGIIFQSGENQYGYGSVISFDEYEMAARLLTYEYPLCNAINFDENGRAIDDVEVLIVGFGRIGHEVLRKVIANGQFEGSKFHATMYDPNCEKRKGFVTSQYPMMFENYNIDFEPQDGRASKLFQFLEDNAHKLKYIVICLKDRDRARAMAIRMLDRLQHLGCPLNVYTCDTKSVRCYSQNVRECGTHWVYDSKLLYSGELDRYAVELNHRYCGGNSASDDWKRCGYFDRMSSRASVDYLIPLLRKIAANGTLTREQRENLAKSEHLRWCAFHYTFGYDVMENEEFIRRVKEAQAEIREHGKSSIKPTKDPAAMKHVCLVGWDELDEVSRTENSLTGGSKDYKDYDRGNVDVVSEIVKDSSTAL